MTVTREDESTAAEACRLPKCAATSEWLTKRRTHARTQTRVLFRHKNRRKSRLQQRGRPLGHGGEGITSERVCGVRGR